MGNMLSTTIQQPISLLVATVLGYKRVIAVRTDPRYPTSWELITHLQTADGVLHSKQDVVVDIKFCRQGYYTCEDGTVAMLIVGRSDAHHEYVRSAPDCSLKNNLLFLRRV